MQVREFHEGDTRKLEAVLRTGARDAELMQAATRPLPHRAAGVRDLSGRTPFGDLERRVHDKLGYRNGGGRSGRRRQ